MAKNILALVDFSDTSVDVVAQAAELSELYQAKCWLIHVADPDPDFVGFDVGPKYIRDHKAEILREEHKQLQAYKETIEQGGVDCEALLIQGELNKTIKDEIEKLDIDMIILGSHGHSRIFEVLVGSVCDYVLRHATVPVVVVPTVVE